jgi:aminopeptidase N
MASINKCPACAAGFLFLAFGTFLPPQTSGQTISSNSIQHHDLFVALAPDSHSLVAIDRLSITITQPQQVIRLSLAQTLHLDRLVLSDPAGSSKEVGTDLPFKVEHDPALPSAQQITISASDVKNGTMVITAYYHGLIDDPPKDPRHLRFVTPSETAGHIGPEGIYLSSESHWYPDMAESLSAFRVRVALPAGWIAVTQARPRTSEPCSSQLCSQAGLTMTEWNPVPPTEALTVVANRFVAKTREWRAPGRQSVQLAAYLFPEDAHLADEYLDATARYLEAYISILGPYPFETFGVVENFFASGLGMPSFTLLGSGVIKRHYVQPYALGHEIVHSWIGNAVFNRVDRGNWVEGLTTYLANYYWHELAGDQAQAREQRRLMLRGYNLHVPPARDYPVGQFTQKHDERDNAIGYQKAAMVFHLLRQEVGEESFWRSLKNLVAQYRGHHADWHDVERVFTETAGKDLRWFFVQWVEGGGAPELSLKNPKAHSTTGKADRAFALTGEVIQTGKVFRFLLPVRLTMEDGRQQLVQMQMKSSQDSFVFYLPAKPMTVELDPETTVMRRVPRQALPPVLTHYVTDRKRSVILALSDSTQESHPFREVVKRIATQEHEKSADERAAIISLDKAQLFPQNGSMLLLGDPASRSALQSLVNRHCGDRLQLRDDGITVAGTAYDGPAIAVLVSCHRQDQPGSVVTVAYAVTAQAAQTMARLLFFYGWNSYVVFKDGTVIGRGEWDAQHETMDVSVGEDAIVQ